MITSTMDKMVNGVIQYGFDNELQVWVDDFKIQCCGHSDYHRTTFGGDCCNGWKYRNHNIRQVKGVCMREG